jgi:peptide/nickel transport system substrate-binding protein
VDAQAGDTGSQLDRARELLASAGYTEGPTGVLTHPDDGPLRLRVGTAEGVEVRLRQQAALLAQFEGTGIELTVDNLPGGRFLRERMFAPEAIAASSTGGIEGDDSLWDIGQFAWLGGPWPGGQSGAFRSASSTNPYGFDDPEFDAAAAQCDGEADDAVRAECYNDLNRWVTTLDNGDEGLFVLPLAQRPGLYAYRNDVLAGVGPATLAVQGGPLAAIVDATFVG